MAGKTQANRQDVMVDVGEVSLEGTLTMPSDASAVVAFAHGSGSSRFSSRNQFVAEQLNKGGLGTLLFDLLTADEHRVDRLTSELRFNIPMLARRLAGTVDWLGSQQATAGLPIGLFGASTGAAAALMVAADRQDRVGAAVSRGGRPDLAGEALERVKAPTLLLVGGEDPVVLDLNRKACKALNVEHHIEVIPNATHLFEEPGTLEQVARLARSWFQHYLIDKNRFDVPPFERLPSDDITISKPR